MTDIKEADTKMESDNDEEEENGNGSFEVIVVVTSGLDPFNLGNDTYVDLRVEHLTTLDSIHDRIVACLDLNDAIEYFYYLKDDPKQKHIKLDSSIATLKLKDRDTLILDSIQENKWKPIKRTVTSFSSEAPSSYKDIPIHVTCVSRIGMASDGKLRKLRLIVNPNDRVSDMLIEVENHFERTGLKFKCGRTVLREDRTFIDLGVTHGSEIVVTGGRG